MESYASEGQVVIEVVLDEQDLHEDPNEEGPIFEYGYDIEQYQSYTFDTESN